jgi:hypothetical protein
MPTDLQRPGLLALRAGIGLLLVLLPFACALVAVAVAPATEVEIAGQPVAVKPVLGQDTTRLLGGTLVRPEHAHAAVLGKDIGVDVDADWNRLIPSDKRTRGYLTALWDDPTPQIARIKEAARRHLITWGCVGLGVGLAASLGTTLGLGYRRRRLAGYPREQADLIRRHNRRLRTTLAVAGVTGLLAIHLVALDLWRHENHHVVVGSPVFDGTSLAGTEVNGLAAEVLPFLSILRPRSTFYDEVAINLERELADVPSLERTDDEVVLVLAEDFEDVNGMARQVGLAADLVDASFLAITGDLTFAGLAVETYIIDTVDYYSRSRPVYFTPGLHDTAVVLAAAEGRGWHVAVGETTETDGLRLLTVPDPRVSTVGAFGVGNLLRDPDVDTERMVRDTIDEACDQDPDLVLLHDHALGLPVAQAGCQQIAVLDGRSFEFVGPQLVPTASDAAAIEFTGGSSGGHTDTRPDPGTIKHPARFTILTVEPETDDASYSVVTVSPDASVTVTPEIELSVPYERYAATGYTGLPPDAAGGTRPGRP